ncbi:MAG TPA: hypothetical protein VI893_07015 [Thermoplasmata archaeon]|nr:hypothetical protein [Thermoplasmata archaeon]
MVDTTVLIALARVGRLDLLSDCFAKVLVPDEVVRELDLPTGHPHAQSGESIRATVSEMGLVTLARRSDRMKTLPKSLGAGEAAAIEHAIGSQRRILLTDDRAARKVAPLVGVECHGTLWVVVLANEMGRLSAEEGRDLIGSLLRTGLRVSADVVVDALSRLH